MNSMCRTYLSKVNAAYDITPLCGQPIEVGLSQPKESKIVIDLERRSVQCGSEGASNACIYVPGMFIRVCI